MKITKKSRNNKDNETTQAFVLYSDDDEPEQNEPVSDIFGLEINQPASSDTPVSPVKQAESLGPLIPPVKPKRKGSTAVFPDSY